MKKINISTPKYPNTFTLVDDEDYKKVKNKKWYVNNLGYVINDKFIKTKKQTILMHRYILGKKCKDLVVDHINHNTIDNRKSNLRPCNKSENAINTGMIKTNTTGYKGISINRSSYEVGLSLNSKRYRVIKKTLKEAIDQYNCMARILHGEYAYQNEIKVIKL